VRDLTHPFAYNNLNSLGKLLGPSWRVCSGNYGALQLHRAWPGFLQGVKDLAQKNGAVLIFDEICSGFHFGFGGAQSCSALLRPGMLRQGDGNGFPISCVWAAPSQRIFDEIFYSFTFAGEVGSMAAR